MRPIRAVDGSRSATTSLCGCLAVLVLLLAADAYGQVVAIQVVTSDGPVADALVRAGVSVSRTDAQGLATVVLAAPTTVISVEAAGFLPASIEVDRASVGETVIQVRLEQLPEFEEDVVVNASRSPTRIQDQPLRVEVIDREEIEEKALMTPGSVAMLIGETTGLRVQPTAPSLGAANVRIQGLRGRYSQLLADGLPLYGGQGDSFSLLQVPPLDLGQVEIIKGVASALYGAAALGGVINLVSRRPTGPEREMLLNQTSRGGSDATLWLADAPTDRWSWTLISGFHAQRRNDVDGDGWTDMAGYERGMVRPRLFYVSGEGATFTATGGLIVENRRGGTLEGRLAPDGSPFAESLDTTRGDVGIVARWLTPSARLMSVRGSYSRQGQDRWFGLLRERGVRDSGFVELSLQGNRAGHAWVIGGAYQHDGYAASDFPRSSYSFDVPSVFGQDEFPLGPVRVSLSGRLDAHDEYGALATPRASLLWRPQTGWRVRLSAGGGAFAPTPFVEDTDETGLARLAALSGLEAERAWGTSFDLTRTVGGFEVTGTLFASRVGNPVQLVEDRGDLLRLVNVEGATRTWGSEILGRYRSGPLLVIATYAYLRSSEVDPDTGARYAVPLTPPHYGTLDLMIEGESWGRAGLELYFVGTQELDDNPYRRSGRTQFIVGALVEKRFERFRLFINAENLGNLRQTRYDPLVRRSRAPDGRWTVDAWAPLDGRVVNGGIRVLF